MAVNTRARRASVLGIALPFNLTLPDPDNVVGSADRQHVAYCYPGIAAALTFLGLAPWHHTWVIHAESRTWRIPHEDRTLRIPDDQRTRDVRH